MARPHHPRSDKNQSAIVRELRSLGFVVCDVSALPVASAGVDLYVWGFNRRTGRTEILGVEVKQPGRKLSRSEAAFAASVGGHGDAPLIIATGTEDILRWFGAL